MRALRRTLGWAVTGALVFGSACGGPQPLGSAGDACVRAADCSPGLVCIEAQCSSDLDQLNGDSTGPGVDAPGGAGPGGSGNASGGAVNGSGGMVSTGGTGLGGAAGGS